MVPVVAEYPEEIYDTGRHTHGVVAKYEGPAVIGSSVNT